MKQILFVDDDPLVLQGLRRMLHPMMRKEWDMRFANSGAEALEMMAAKQADVVVSDMRMPSMNGAQLLNKIMHQYPRAIRFILSGYSDLELIMQCVDGTHQFLSKPCDSETLQMAILRALDLDKWINNEALKSIVSQLKTIPSLPSLYFEILKELRSPEANLERAGATIAQDPAMTAKILQLTNSAFFGLSRHLSSPTEAVVQLGLETIKSLVLTIHVFSEFQLQNIQSGEISRLHNHSLRTAAIGKSIAMMESKELSLQSEAFTAGLLHDIGRLVLMANLPEGYGEAVALARAKSIPRTEAERSIFGVSHAEVGAYLLGLWGLPIPIVETTLFHHAPHLCPSSKFTSLAAVHVANRLAAEDQIPELQPLLKRLDQEFLTKAGLWDRIPVWLEHLSKRKPTPAPSV